MKKGEEDGSGGNGSSDGTATNTPTTPTEQQEKQQQQQHEHEYVEEKSISNSNSNNNRKKVVTTTTTKLAFGSCHKNRKVSKRPNIWDSIGSETNLDGWIWTGDSIYPSSRDPITHKKRYGPADPSLLKEAYDELKTNSTIGYKSNILDKHIPTYGTWDDHDYGGNDMGLEMKFKNERKRLFLDFLNYDNDDSPSLPPPPPAAANDDDDDHPVAGGGGVYHSIEGLHDNGDLQLIFLDTRWFRQEHCIKSASHILPMGNAIACFTRWLTSGLLLHKIAWLWGREGCEHNTILGSQQWDWFESTLLQSKAKVHIIISSIQVWTTNPAMESWGQFPSEQKRLHSLLERHYSQSPSEPVIILSGDVHHGEIINSPKSGLLEITSSGLTHYCSQPFGYGMLCRPILETFHKHRYNNNNNKPNNDGDDNDDNNNKNYYYIGLNYGILIMNDTTITIQIKDWKGNTKLQVEQPYGDSNHKITIPPYKELPQTWDGHLIPLLQGLILSILITIIIFRRGRVVGGGAGR